MVQVFDLHFVENCRRKNVDPLRDFCSIPSNDLGAQQPMRLAIPGDSNLHLFGARIIGLVVPSFRLNGKGVKTLFQRLVIAQTGPGHDKVENLDNLGA